MGPGRVVYMNRDHFAQAVITLVNQELGIHGLATCLLCLPRPVELG